MAIVGDAQIIVHAITTQFEKEVEDAMSKLRPKFDKLGNDLGNSLNRGVNRGSRGAFQNFIRESEMAKKKFNSLVRMGYLIGPAIYGALSSISALVSGLFAVGAAAGAAIPSVVALGGAFSALLQAGAVLKLAFSGVTKALQEQSKAASSSIDIKKRLAKEDQNYADALYNANKRLARAQKDLNTAMKEGAEWMQQLGFDAEDAALAQQRAAMDLEDARQNLMRVQDQPANSRARVEADLAFREADLNYRRAADRAKDLAKQKEEADKAGLKGTEQVTNAQEDLTEAERNLWKVKRDHLQALADIKSGSSAATSAMSKLSAEAQHFVKYLMSLKPVLKDLQAAAGRYLFPQLEQALGRLVKVLVPPLIPILEETGRAIGWVADQFSKMLTKTENVNIIKRVFGETNPKVIRNFGEAFTNISQAILYILDAARPVTLELSLWAKQASKNLATWLGLENSTGRLTVRFQTAAEYFKQIKNVLGQVAGGIGALGKAAAPAGLTILKAFGGAFEKLEKYAKSREGVATLSKQFEQIGKNVIAMGGFFTDVLKILFRMGADEGTSKFFNRMRDDVLPIVEKIAGSFSQAEPFVEEFVVQVATLIGNLTESGGIENFFSTMSKAFEILNKLFSNPIVKQVFLFTAAIHGTTLALGWLAKGASFLGKAFVGKLKLVADAMKLLMHPIASIQKGLGAVSAALGIGTGPLIAIAAVVAVLVMAYKKSEIFRKSISDLITSVGKAFSGALAVINDAIKDVAPQIDGLGGLFKWIGDMLGTYIVPILQFVLVNAIGLVAGAISLLIRTGAGLVEFFRVGIKGISDFVSAIGRIGGSAWNWLTNGLSNAWNATRNFFTTTIPNAVRNLRDTITNIGRNMWSGITGGLSAAWETARRWWNSNIAGRGVTIDVPDWMPGPDVIKINIPKLAQGGIVMPRNGGTLAQIAEAGRPERVEPLDPDGLSKRDKALIEMMIKNLGGAQGTPTQVIVNPAPRMDEREIGHVAAREIAWAQRRGGGF